ncbi:MAG: NAD(P)/FAD-dependent oxidoreductase [Oscillospiraceae bacterium]
MEYSSLLTAGKIGNVTIKNRIVMSAMLLDHGQFNGTPTEQMMDYYEERAKGGVGLIITEITRVNDVHGAGALAQLAVSHDYHIKPLTEMIGRIHSHDCKVFIQLHHAGWQAEIMTVGMVPPVIAIEKILPSFGRKFYDMVPFAQKLKEKGLLLSVAAPSKIEPNRYTGAKNRALRRSEIIKLEKQFIAGAKRVQLAGADGVELHAAHGYLIQQFLSPNTNRRKDEYGGSLENRMRFLLEIIEGIRSACGSDFPISVRLSVDECYDRIGEAGKGIALEEGIKIAKRLEEAGIDAINVSSANYETMNYWLEPASFEPSWRKYMAAAVKKEVKIPVIAANLIRSPEQAEQQISEGTQDFIALGRPLLADPQWVNKVREGRAQDIKRCICCLWCFESMQANAYLGCAGECAINPAMGHEKEMNNLPKNGDGRVIVIVGAGPAGLTAAEILARRNFKVTVLEKNPYVGGQLRLADKPPLKSKIDWCFEDLERAAIASGAEIVLSTEATAEKIDEYKPYAIIIATGGYSVRPSSIEGVRLPNVCTITEILDGTAKLTGKNVAVIGSGMSGLETAEKLASDGNTVTVVEMEDRISPQTYSQHLDDIMPRLEKYGVRFITGHRLAKISEHSITLESVGTKRTRTVEADYVVLSVGVKSENRLFKELESTHRSVYIIGDAKKVGRIAQATRSAFETALKLN